MDGWNKQQVSNSPPLLQAAANGLFGCALFALKVPWVKVTSQRRPMARPHAAGANAALVAAGLLLNRAGPGEPYEHTLLLVLGDHAQTLSGDHGGGSADETDTLLLAFNIGKWAELRRLRQCSLNETAAEGSEQTGCASSCTSSDALAAERLELLAGYDEGACSFVPGSTAGSAPHCKPAASCRCTANTTDGGAAPAVSTAPCSTSLQGVMPQVDFAASLSLSLGLPIPFGNTGKLDPSWWDMAQPLAGCQPLCHSPQAAVHLAGTGSLAEAQVSSCASETHTQEESRAGGAVSAGADEQFAAGATGGQHDSEDNGGCSVGGSGGTIEAAARGLPQPLSSYVRSLQYNAWQVGCTSGELL